MNVLSLICDTLYMGEVEVNHFIQQSPHRYKVYEIPKRQGRKKRTIAQPSKELKFIQRLVMKEYFSELSVHTCAHAYVEGSSIKGNAQKHLNSRYLLKMDFKDFFPSIKPDAFFAYLHDQGFEITEADKALIERIFFWLPRNSAELILSIGAPSSPRISNLIMGPFDHFISNICKEKNVTYTRYADDLTFTTNEENVLFEFPKIVESACKNIPYPSLSINEGKTVFSSKKHNRHVTGLVLTNDNRISIGRDKKRAIKSWIYSFTKGGLPREDINRLKGHLAYIQDVEPTFLESLERKYSPQIIDSIKRFGNQ